MLKLMLTIMFFSQLSYADIILPEQSSCKDKAKDDACTINDKVGLCQESTCSKLDYSRGSPPQGTIKYTCLKCNTTLPAGTAVVEAKEHEHDCAGVKTNSCNALGEPPTLMLLSLTLGFWLVKRLRRREL